MAIGRVNTGGGGTGGKLIVTAPVGAAATCEKDGRVYTRTIRPDGTAIFSGLKTGVWTVTITMEGELPSSQDVLITADYAVTLAFFSSLCTVHYPVGSQCICTDGDITLTATDTSGRFVFNIQRVGRWYIRCTDGSQNAERYIDVTASGQTFEITLAYFAATINVTYPIGSDCTCTKGNIVYTAPDKSGVATFMVPETGDWTISCSNESTGDSTEQTVKITEDGQSESITLDYKLILYSPGDEHTDITGGWIAQARAYKSIFTSKAPSLTKGSTGMSVSMARGLNSGCISTTSPIDLSEISALIIEYEYSTVGSGSDSNGIFVLFVDDSTSGYQQNSDARKNSPNYYAGTSGTDTLILDVSSINSAYVCIGLVNNTEKTTFSGKILSVKEV